MDGQGASTQTGEAQQDLAQDLTGLAAGANAVTRFECPECKAQGIEKILKSAQGLARHRSVTHGVKGSSRRSAARRSRSSSRQAPRQRAAVKQFDRTAAVKVVSPDGLMRVEDMDRLSLWLDQGEAIFNARQPRQQPRRRRKGR